MLENELDSILQQAQEAKQNQLDLGSVQRLRNRTENRRLNAPKIGQDSACCFCLVEPTGPYQVGQYNPDLDAWQATCTKTGFEFWGKPLNDGAMGTGDILPGYVGNPGGLLNPKKARDPRRPRPKTTDVRIKVEIAIGYTGKA